MALVTKTDPTGIDKAIDRIQKALYTGLVTNGTWTIYESYNRSYQQESSKGIQAEAFTSVNDYKDVFFDDKKNASSFFVVDNDRPVSDGTEYTTEIGIIFQVKLNRLIDSTITHRTDEEVHHQVANILEDVGFGYENLGLQTSIDLVYAEFDTEQLTYDDMQPFHVFRFNMNVNYTYDCNVSFAAAPPPETTPDDFDGLKWWVETYDTSTINSGVNSHLDGVFDWADMSSNSNDGVQLSGASQPILNKTSSLSPLNYIHNIGSPHELNFGKGFSKMANHAVFLLFSAEASAASVQAILAETDPLTQNTNTGITVYQDSGFTKRYVSSMGDGAGGFLIEKSTDIMPLGTFVLFEQTYTAGDNFFTRKVNGVDLGLFSTSGSATSIAGTAYDMVMGAFGESGAFNGNFKIKAGIAYDQVHTDLDMSSIRAYVNNRYSVY